MIYRSLKTVQAMEYTKTDTSFLFIIITIMTSIIFITDYTPIMLHHVNNDYNQL